MASSVSLETEWAEAGEGESFEELHDAIAEGKAELFKADNPGVQYGKFLTPKGFFFPKHVDQIRRLGN